MSAAATPRVAIVGAGLAGSLMAVFLGRRGWTVDVYERRPDPRRPDDGGEGRSINLGLSHRGIEALRQAGMADEVLAASVRARGRVIHAPDGSVKFQPYGTRENECLHSISRADLNRALIQRADAHPGVAFHFGWRCEDVDADAGRLVLRADDGAERTVEADVVVGADGAFSAVRPRMQRGRRADHHREFLPWGYKELTLRPGPDGESRIELEALHVWPRGDGLIVTHPNPDRSHTVTVFLPFEGPDGFDALTTPDAVLAFFRRVFPDVVPVVPDLVREFLGNPTGTLVSTRTAPWHAGGRVVLVGDACHAVYPFYGQGMNAALEDCTVLDACLGAHPGDAAAAFAAYEARRRPHTDALHTLVARNFDELRDTAGQPTFVARKKVDLWLSRLFPGRWIPLYTMVVHTTIPYAEAMARHRRQERIRRMLGIDALLAVVLPAGVAAGRMARGVRAALRPAPRVPAAAAAAPPSATR